MMLEACPLNYPGASPKGLVTDNFTPRGFDEARADTFHRQLMDAAAYLPGVQSHIAGAASEMVAVVTFLTTQTGDGDLGTRLFERARRLPDLSAEEQIVVRYLVGTLTSEA